MLELVGNSYYGRAIREELEMREPAMNIIRLGWTGVDPIVKTMNALEETGNDCE